MTGHQGRRLPQRALCAIAATHGTRPDLLRGPADDPDARNWHGSANTATTPARMPRIARFTAELMRWTA